MRVFFFCLLFLYPQPPAMSAVTGASASSNLPAQELLQLDQDLSQAEKARDEGKMTARSFHEFSAQMLSELETISSRIDSSQANVILHAAILSRLGERDQAVKALSRLILRDPQNTTLRLALGRERLAQEDFAGGLSEAESVLKQEPLNQEALAIKHQCLGRVSAIQSRAPKSVSAIQPPIPTPPFTKDVNSDLRFKSAPNRGKALQPPSPDHTARPTPKAAVQPSGVQEALNTLSLSGVGREITDFLSKNAVPITISSLLPPGSAALYDRDAHSILIPSGFANEPLAARASMLAHESWHARQHAAGATGTVEMEIDAWRRGIAAYHEMLKAGVKPAPQNHFIERVYQNFLRLAKNGKLYEFEKMVRNDYADNSRQRREVIAASFGPLSPAAGWALEALSWPAFWNSMTVKEIHASRLGRRLSGEAALYQTSRQHKDEEEWIQKWSKIEFP